MDEYSIRDLTWVLKHLRAKAGTYGLYRQYYDGVHRLAFTTERWRSEFGLMVKGVADNHCPTVVDTLVDRLEIVGFSGSGDERAKELWKNNRMDLRSGELHKEAAKQGDAFLLIWPDESNEPIFYLETADKMCVRYSVETPGKVVFAGKAWIDYDDKAYATLYYPDRIEKYITKVKVSGLLLPDKGDASTWEQRTVVVGVDVDDTGTETELTEPWPLPNPFGRVPIFHFPNDGTLGGYGRSELRDVIPLQDILNKDLSDRLITQEFHSFPQRWAIGLQPDYDAEGNAKSPKAGPDRLWFTDNEAAKFGQFDASSLQGFIDIAENDRMEIARVSKTPVHQVAGMTGTPPSGEALRTMESPLMAKVEDRQSLYGAVWEDAMEFAVSLPSGTGEFDLTCDWKDTTSISDKEKAEGLVLKQTLGVPKQQLWKELGYTPEEIEEMLAMEAEAAEEAAAQFNAGVDTGFETGGAGQPAPVAPGGNGVEPRVIANDITGQ